MTNRCRFCGLTLDHRSRDNHEYRCPEDDFRFLDADEAKSWAYEMGYAVYDP